MALPAEGGHHFEAEGLNVTYTGLGKVNATYALTRALCQFRPELVLNFGTAGSNKYRKGEMISVSRFIQRDMDVSPLGYKPGTTPFEKIPSVIRHENWFPDLTEGSCGTGDRFETNHNKDHGDVVDMEAYALAKVCWMEGIPFGCVKYVSDGADDKASEHWEESIEEIESHFLDLFMQTF